MSTSSIWWARRTTSSGTVSRCGTRVIFSTTSLRDSRCWMFSAGDDVDPGGEQCPRCPATAWGCGRRPGRCCGRTRRRAPPAGGARGPRRGPSPSNSPAAVRAAAHAGTTSRPSSIASVPRPAVALHEPDHHIRAACGPASPLVEHAVGLADPGGRPEIDLQPSGPYLAHVRGTPPATGRTSPPPVRTSLIPVRTSLIAADVLHSLAIDSPEGRVASPTEPLLASHGPLPDASLAPVTGTLTLS